MLHVHSARPSDARYIADRMRDIDVTECIALGTHPYEALLGGLKGVAHTALDDSDAPVAMFGVMPNTPKDWTIWLLGTDEVEDYSVSLIKLSRFWLPLFFELSNADTFYNFVLADNHRAISYLEVVGAVFDDDDYFYSGERFLRFELRRDLCAPSPSHSLP